MVTKTTKKAESGRKARYPRNDYDFEEVKIKDVRAETGGWTITRHDYGCFFVPDSSPVAPKPGMRARFYPRGMGYMVRGLFLDGQRVFYRSADAQRAHLNEQLYGKDAADWLKRWDEGRSVWSIEMGGLGPGYEQAIQITVAEILRHLLSANYDASKWDDREAWQNDRKQIDVAAFANERIDKLGLSGAQFGAALNLAGSLYKRGPQATLLDQRVKDRLIQVSSSFPTVTQLAA